MNNKLLIIDGDFILFSATHGNKCLDEFGNPIKEDNKFVYTPKTLEEVYECVDQIIYDIVDKNDCTPYIGYLGHTKNFRYDIYPEYKANRKARELPPFFQECKDYLVKSWNFQLCTLPLEADDYVNITRNRLKDDYDVIVVSNDKDLIKCTPGKFYCPGKGELIETSYDQAAYAFYYSMITGDQTDNIKGIPGRGPKYAERILKDLNNYTEYYQAVVKAYTDNLPEDTAIDQFRLNYKLLWIVNDHEEFELPEISYVLRKRQINLPDDWDVAEEKIDGREINTSF